MGGGKTRSRDWANMDSVYLTTQFRGHNPSRLKRAIPEWAMWIYTSAYAKLLKLATEKESEIEEVCRFSESTSTKKLSNYLSRLFSPYIDSIDSFPIHSSMRDSLYQDVARNLASYFELKEKSREDSEARPPSWSAIGNIDSRNFGLFYEPDVDVFWTRVFLVSYAM